MPQTPAKLLCQTCFPPDGPHFVEIYADKTHLATLQGAEANYEIELHFGVGERGVRISPEALIACIQEAKRRIYKGMSPELWPMFEDEAQP